MSSDRSDSLSKSPRDDLTLLGSASKHDYDGVIDVGAKDDAKISNESENRKIKKGEDHGERS